MADVVELDHTIRIMFVDGIPNGIWTEGHLHFDSLTPGVVSLIAIHDGAIREIRTWVFERSWLSQLLLEGKHTSGASNGLIREKTVNLTIQNPLGTMRIDVSLRATRNFMREVEKLAPLGDIVDNELDALLQEPE